MTARTAYDALLLDYAAGALAPAPALLVETHLRLKPGARAAAGVFDAAGGALLEAIAPVAVAAATVPDPGPAPEAAEAPDRLVARAIIAAATEHPDTLRWRWRAPGLREARLPLAGASIIRLVGGGALAPHGHTDDEFTLVLRGRFSDSVGAYAVGDIGFADEDLDHSPTVPPGEDCICLVATAGDLKFHSVVARVTARLLA